MAELCSGSIQFVSIMLVNLHWIDIVILVVYLGVLTGIGIYFSKHQKSLEDFFLARRGITWFPVGLSLMAAINSGMEYLMVPSAIIKFGVTILHLERCVTILHHVRRGSRCLNGEFLFSQ